MYKDDQGDEMTEIGNNSLHMEVMQTMTILEIMTIILLMRVAELIKENPCNQAK